MHKDIKEYLNQTLRKAFQARQQGLLSDKEFLAIYMKFLDHTKTCYWLSDNLTYPNLSKQTVLDKLYYENCSLKDLDEMNHEATQDLIEVQV